MSWRKISKYGIALFVAQFLVGLADGFFGPAWSAEELHLGMAWMFGSWLVLFSVCSSIFARMAIHQPSRAFAHAWLALLLPVVIGVVLNLAISRFLAPAPMFFIAIEIVVMAAALFVGTLVGLIIKGRAEADQANV